jgi:hypothetical protein
MAIDVLAIQATSVPSERKFAGLVDIITPNRSSLNSSSIQMVHELKGFMNFGGKELQQLTLMLDN